MSEKVGGVEILPDGSFRVLTGEPAKEKALTPLEARGLEHGDRAA